MAFVLDQGVDLIHPFLVDLLASGGELRLLTGDYYEVTEPRGLERLLDLTGNAHLRVFETKGQAFHPKAYVCHFPSGDGVAFVGSSNLSRSALGNGVEWNYRIVRSSDAPGFASICRQFEALFRHEKVVPLTHEWVRGYRERRRPDVVRPLVGVPDEQLPPATPHTIQREALAALHRSRADGNRAALVVLATGLGKTWLSAFDTVAFAQETNQDLESQRVLFVAHREEILDQALATFRRIRPGCLMGKYTGGEKTPTATVLFASVQTLSKAQHLRRFAPDHFDYIVIDEFHHAAARTYVGLIDYFVPRFLLGLTATPERTDGGELLALCGHNLVFRCALSDGVKAGLLCPFRYFGIPDDVDYSAVPWSRQSGRFDELELTRALATEKRAANALEQWRAYGGSRGLGFCCSQNHADYMAKFFCEEGVRAVAVHSGESTSPRASSLLDLREGRLELLFCVDMFNEGVDLPQVDTVLMLRPTQSRIVWLQQFGRGLRTAQDKVLRVVDYIGNHRVFLTNVQALMSSILGHGEGHADLRRALGDLRAGTAEFPPGCDITYDLQVVDVLTEMLRPTTAEDQLREVYEEFRMQHGRRPTARDMFMNGSLSKASLRRGYGSWFGLVRQMGDLSYMQRELTERFASFLGEVEHTRMERSYKMLVLEAMIEEGCLPGAITVPTLAARFQRIADRSPTTRRELQLTMEESGGSLEAMLRSNPLRAWAGTKRGRGSDFFELAGDRFATRFAMGEESAQVGDSEQRETLAELVRELAAWRLAEYHEQADPLQVPCRVTHNSSGNPIVMLDRKAALQLPEGPTRVVVDGVDYEMNFAKIAVNVAYPPHDPERRNRLPDILRGWFGPNAGHAGRGDVIVFELGPDRVCLRPRSPRAASTLEIGQSYMRESIPGFFDAEFNTSAWRQGIVSVTRGLVLLVTLDKQGAVEEHKYKDRFLSDHEFQWQSQNQTRREGKHGKLIRGRGAGDNEIHLFVRKRPKRSNSKAAPFFYCGRLEFQRWDGERPITVWWRLQTPLSPDLAAHFA